jgi:hypothetical protein
MLTILYCYCNKRALYSIGFKRYERELYINVTGKDALAIIVMYINVTGKNLLAIIVIREICT